VVKHLTLNEYTEPNMLKICTKHCNKSGHFDSDHYISYAVATLWSNS